MSRRAVPLLVAGVTGVLSGIYIFKPLFDQSNGIEQVSRPYHPAKPQAELETPLRDRSSTDGAGASNVYSNASRTGVESTAQHAQVSGGGHSMT
ncbi:hypothetical protein PYCCODRAFT_1083007 [Trametes coccinea BRFM310]|uniref:Uncharacterized protein n=1 Tax=Trametes coccinea (strain BRFM310) TaxID=1353009 RepID=A0A1Y2IZP6_TRAC3|nr:hypothetical protein PYCCODRAFT_1083007 [Trametes coccinea BRFM310]